MNKFLALAAATAAISLTAAGVGAASADGASHATATIIDAGGVEIGFAKFVEDGDGIVHVNIKVSGLSAGLHGVHIHERGSCSLPGPFSNAGSHYRAAGTLHPEHYGDLPNMTVNDDGQGRLNATTDRVTLSDGPATVFDTTTDFVGSAIVIHALEDEGTPTNFGGGRIACGVITGA